MLTNDVQGDELARRMHMHQMDTLTVDLHHMGHTVLHPCAEKLIRVLLIHIAARS